MKPSIAQTESRWPHRLAVVLVCATFPLIFAGSLVTTYNAGMAVPDWPSTYGYNLFLYPWQTWLFGPWDLFIEHGHRLLGALVGMLTIAFMLSVLLLDGRRWVKALSVLALAAVIAQGLLGGARVLLDQRMLAMIHGCFGPAFFAFCVALAVFTSRRWRESSGVSAKGAGYVRFQRLSVITLVLSFVQILLGAQLRHVPVDASPSSFRALVVFHVVMAFVLLGHAAVLVFLACMGHAGHWAVVFSTWLLASFLVLQVGLGVGTWMVNYGWPDWDETFPFAAGYTIHAEGMLQTNIVTAHVALGSLILAAAAQLCARSLRLLRPAVDDQSASVRLEAA
ncbi:MAG: COX15/CtaA family protein [Pirellulaceae bacterium]